MVKIAEYVVFDDLSGSYLVSRCMLCNAGLILEVVRQEVIVVVDLFLDFSLQPRSQDVLCGVVLLGDGSDVLPGRRGFHALLTLVCALVTLGTAHFRINYKLGAKLF
jgi:hypothetical protein